MMMKKIKNSVVIVIKAICFGKTNASVVMLRKMRGKVRRNSPIKKRLMFSKYEVICLFDLFIRAI